MHCTDRDYICNLDESTNIYVQYSGAVRESESEANVQMARNQPQLYIGDCQSLASQEGERSLYIL